jgi:hypothetical protein
MSHEVAEVKDGKIEVEMLADKVTPGAHGAGEADGPLSAYLRKEQAEALGLPIDEGREDLGRDLLEAVSPTRVARGGGQRRPRDGVAFCMAMMGLREKLGEHRT